MNHVKPVMADFDMSRHHLTPVIYINIDTVCFVYHLEWTIHKLNVTRLNAKPLSDCFLFDFVAHPDRACHVITSRLQWAAL